MARRKFYSELFGTTVNSVESYVRRFRTRNGLKPNSPFGVERAKLKDQIYLSLRTDTDKTQRVELHRLHLVMGMGPGEVVETALICTGKDTSPLTLGLFRYGWLTGEGRIYSHFNAHETPHVRSLNLSGLGSLDALTAPESAEESPTCVSQTPPTASQKLALSTLCLSMSRLKHVSSRGNFWQVAADLGATLGSTATTVLQRSSAAEIRVRGRCIIVLTTLPPTYGAQYTEKQIESDAGMSPVPMNWHQYYPNISVSMSSVRDKKRLYRTYCRVSLPS